MHGFPFSRTGTPQQALKCENVKSGLIKTEKRKKRLLQRRKVAAEAEAFVLLPLLPPSFHFLPPNPSPLISAEGGKKERDEGGGGEPFLQGFIPFLSWK